jgi:hypothetical protein
MPKIFFNKYTNWEKDLTYKESDREDLELYTIKELTEEQFSELATLTINQIREVINTII